MEYQLISALNFDFTFATSHCLLMRFQTLANIAANREASLFSEYICELTLIDSKMNKWKPSQIATACLYLAKKILKLAKPWCPTLQEKSQLTEKQVRECAHDIVVILNSAPKQKKFASIYGKYSTTRFGRVA